MSIDPVKSVIAIDPGSVKCGLVYLEMNDKPVIERSVVPAETLVVSVSKLLREHSLVDVIVVGSGTGSGKLSRALRDSFPGKTIELVDEKGTSLLARARYFDDHPPKGWRRLVPIGMQLPQEPYDDYAALLLAERYLNTHFPEKQP